VAIRDLKKNFLQNFDKKLVSCTIYLGHRKAFDSVNHSVVLTKLME